MAGNVFEKGLGSAVSPVRFQGKTSKFGPFAAILLSSQPRDRLRGGEGGIRTLGTGISPYNGLANRRLQPLGHLSGVVTKHLQCWQGLLLGAMENRRRQVTQSQRPFVI
jgi:hypothetical protein